MNFLLRIHVPEMRLRFVAWQFGLGANTHHGFLSRSSFHPHTLTDRLVKSRFSCNPVPSLLGLSRILPTHYLSCVCTTENLLNSDTERRLKFTSCSSPQTSNSFFWYLFTTCLENREKHKRRRSAENTKIVYPIHLVCLSPRLCGQKWFHVLVRIVSKR